MRTRRRFAFCLAFISAIACGRAEGAPSRKSAADSARRDSIARARQDSLNRAQPGYVIDSARSPKEDLRRFRDMLGGPAAVALRGGATSRDALVHRFVDAVSKRDTAALRTMVLTAREYADLVYPSSAFMHPPFEQPAALAWTQIAHPSVSGFKRLIERRGGVRYTLASYQCDAKAKREGKNIFWSDCSLRLTAPEYGSATERWFGSVIERDGRFKFVSYANQF